MYRFNRNIFTDDHFTPSRVTDRPPAAEIPPKSQKTPYVAQLPDEIIPALGNDANESENVADKSSPCQKTKAKAAVRTLLSQCLLAAK